MENNYILELKDIESQIDLIWLERNEVLKKMKDLEKIEGVIEYIKLSSVNEKQYNNLCSLRERYVILKQKSCNHPLWYFINEETDTYEGRTYYSCKCLECDLIEERRSRDFDNIIKGNYKELKEEYDKRKSSPVVKAKQMTKKFTGGKK